MSPNQSPHARVCRVLRRLTATPAGPAVKLIAAMQAIGITKPTDQARLTGLDVGQVVKARADAAFFLDDLRG